MVLRFVRERTARREQLPGIQLLPISSHPMQSQSWHKKEKYQHHAQLEEKQQNQFSEFLLLNFKEMRRPGYTGVPKEIRGDKVEQSKGKADDKGAEEHVPEENDLFVFHIW